MAFTEKYVSSLAGGSGNGLSEGTAFTWGQMVAEINGALGAGVRYNVKADGTYSRTTTNDDMNVGTGTATSPIYIRGYKTTIGDGYLGRDSVGALITTNMPTILYTDGWLNGPQLAVIESISILKTVASGGNSVLFRNNHKSAMIACTVSSARNSGDSRVAILGGDYSLCWESDFFMTATSGPNLDMATSDNAGVKIDCCRFICSCTTITSGLKADMATSVYGCLFKGAGAGAAIYFNDNRPVFARNNTIVGWQDGVRWNTAGNNQVGWICGNIITDNARYGINLSSGTAWMGIVGPNRTRDNVSGDTSSSTLDWAQAGRILPLITTDTGGPETDYVAAASNNYNLIAASPAIAGNRPKFSDLGAYGLQHPTGGGGGTAVFNPLAQTIIRPTP